MQHEELCTSTTYSENAPYLQVMLYANSQIANFTVIPNCSSSTSTVGLPGLNLERSRVYMQVILKLLDTRLLVSGHCPVSHLSSIIYSILINYGQPAYTRNELYPSKLTRVL